MFLISTAVYLSIACLKLQICNYYCSTAEKDKRGVPIPITSYRYGIIQSPAFWNHATKQQAHETFQRLMYSKKEKKN